MNTLNPTFTDTADRLPMDWREYRDALHDAQGHGRLAREAIYWACNCFELRYRAHVSDAYGHARFAARAAFKILGRS